MTKKVEKAESCECREGGCCCSKIVIILVSLIGAVVAIFACIYAYKASQTAQRVYDFNVLSAGGQENFDKMNEIYSSDAYVKYATDQTQQTEEYFGLSEGDGSTATVDTNDDTPSYTAGGSDIQAVVEDILANNPIRGDENARFTIVEYTELLCPYCQRHSTEGTINTVIDQFPGEVNSVSRHFIIHGDPALQLAAAMECVSELNPSAYHSTFERAFEAYPVDLDTLLSIAVDLGTDSSALQSCVDEGRYTQAVEDMMNQGNELFGVNGTPGNVIIDRETGNYELVSGAYPVETFVETINAMKNA